MSAPHSEISIVMPVHNCASWLGESVESLLNQDFDTFELILIDDGSTDESLDMARLYAERDTRITVYSQPHLGAAAARNAGLEAACGQYMLFLDSDDLFEPTLLSRLHEEAEKSGADIVVCQADAFFEDDARNRKPLHVPRRLRPGIYRTEELEAYLFQ